MPDVDYDAPRKSSPDLTEGSLDELRERRRNVQSPDVDEDGSAELDDLPPLPETDLVDGELTVAVVPIQSNEFRCCRCFLVHHRARLGRTEGKNEWCQDCA
jgi:hypothetical protein